MPLGDPTRAVPRGGEFGGRAILHEVGRIRDELVAVDFDLALLACEDRSVQRATTVWLFIGYVQANLDAIGVTKYEPRLRPLFNRPELDRTGVVGAKGVLHHVEGVCPEECNAIPRVITPMAPALQ